jgi:hypothetical protein
VLCPVVMGLALAVPTLSNPPSVGFRTAMISSHNLLSVTRTNLFLSSYSMYADHRRCGRE